MRYSRGPPIGRVALSLSDMFGLFLRRQQFVQLGLHLYCDIFPSFDIVFVLSKHRQNRDMDTVSILSILLQLNRGEGDDLDYILVVHNRGFDDHVGVFGLCWCQAPNTFLPTFGQNIFI